MLLPLIAVYLLTALAVAAAQLFPDAREIAFLGVLLDLVPFAGGIAAAAMAWARLRGQPRSRLAAAVGCHLAGLVVGALGVAHLTAVVMAAIERSRLAPFVYTFRLYSLLLLGALFLAAGAVAAAQTEALADGRRAAWRASAVLWLAVLAVNLPLAPLQRFAGVFVAIAAGVLILLVATRRGFGEG